MRKDAIFAARFAFTCLASDNGEIERVTQCHTDAFACRVFVVSCEKDSISLQGHLFPPPPAHASTAEDLSKEMILAQHKDIPFRAKSYHIFTFGLHNERYLKVVLSKRRGKGRDFFLYKNHQKNIKNYRNYPV